MEMYTAKFIATIPHQVEVYVEVPAGNGIPLSVVMDTIREYVKSGRNTEIRFDPVEIECTELMCPDLSHTVLSTGADGFDFMSGGFERNLPPRLNELVDSDPDDTSPDSICDVSDGDCVEDEEYLCS